MNLDSITATNQRDSPLLRLPAELRNKIFLYAFDDNNVYLAPKVIRRDFLGPEISPYPMSLAQTCTQCRHEALPYFWQNTVFHLIYNRMDHLVRDTSQSMRDRIEVVRPDYSVSWDLQKTSCCYEGAFGRVQKVIMVYRRPPGVTKDAFTEVMRETYGGDAELVDAYGKRYVWDH